MEAPTERARPSTAAKRRREKQNARKNARTHQSMLRSNPQTGWRETSSAFAGRSRARAWAGARGGAGVGQGQAGKRPGGRREGCPDRRGRGLAASVSTQRCDAQSTLARRFSTPCDPLSDRDYQQIDLGLLCDSGAKGARCKTRLKRHFERKVQSAGLSGATTWRPAQFQDDPSDERPAGERGDWGQRGDNGAEEALGNRTQWEWIRDLSPGRREDAISTAMRKASVSHSRM